MFTFYKKIFHPISTGKQYRKYKTALKAWLLPGWRVVIGIPCFSQLKASLAIVIPVLMLWMLASCDSTPRETRIINVIQQAPANIPPGEHLYCITNIGHTMTVFDRPGHSNRFLKLDPVGPWFDSDAGYYISRVEGGGGANALLRFSPQTLLETGEIRFGANSNPNQLLILGSDDKIGWVALRGSNFDSFATVAIAVVDLENMNGLDSVSLEELVPADRRNNEKLTSILGFVWDEDCPAPSGGGCAYAIVNNWNGETNSHGGNRAGWLLVLQPDAQGLPQLVGDVVQLGISPQLLALLYDENLWVVINAGYASFGSGEPGYLQKISTSTLFDGASNDIQKSPLASNCSGVASGEREDSQGCDPNGISLSPQADIAWVYTGFHGHIRVLDLSTETLQDDNATVQLTGPLFKVSNPTPRVFSGVGGFGEARLAELNSHPGADGKTIYYIANEYDLNAGRGGLGCAAYTVEP